MFLKNKQSGTLIEILDIESLFSPTRDEVQGQDQAGQEEQYPTSYKKQQLVFPSGEDLPRCWLDADYTTNGL